MFGRTSRNVVLRFRRPRIAAVVVLTAGALSVAASPASADVTSVKGGAFGESVNVTPLGLLNVTSGPIPTVTLPAGGGGPFTDSLASVCVPTTTCALLKTGILNVSTQGTLGASGGSSSSASVANVGALAGTPGVLTATAVSSKCSVGPNSSSGSSTIAGATFLGQALDVNPAPNTTINLPGVATLILNEQIPTGGPGDYSLTVNAIHLKLGPVLGSGDIIIAQSRCGEAGPDVTIPFAPIGIIGTTAVLGVVLLRIQRRRPDADDTPAITS
jgi:hypothetical protein